MGREASWSTLGILDDQEVPMEDSILLAYGTEVIIPFDICMPTLHTEIINRESTEEKIVGKLRAN